MMYTIIAVRSGEENLTLVRPPAGLLTAEEAAVFAGLKSAKRQQDWLTGRYAAKHLLQHAWREETGRHLSFNDFSVLKKGSGAPQIKWRIGNDHRPATLSISHAGKLAFCALSFRQNAFLGCDVEQVAQRSPAFVADYFTPAEQALVQHAPPGRQALCANTIWSAKEAVLKALELGLTVDTRAVTCLPEFSPLPCCRLFSVALDTERITRPVPEMSGRWWVSGDYVFTLVAPITIFANEAVIDVSPVFFPEPVL